MWYVICIICFLLGEILAVGNGKISSKILLKKIGWAIIWPIPWSIMMAEITYKVMKGKKEDE